MVGIGGQWVADAFNSLKTNTLMAQWHGTSFPTWRTTDNGTCVMCVSWRVNIYVREKKTKNRQYIIEKRYWHQA